MLIFEQTKNYKALPDNVSRLNDLKGLFSAWANIYEPVKFTSEELKILYLTGELELFNLVFPLDEIHAAIMNVLRNYSIKWEALIAQLPGATMVGSTGLTRLNNEEFQRIAPYAAQLDALASEIASKVEAETRLAKKAMNGYTKVLREKLHMDIPDLGSVIADAT